MGVYRCDWDNGDLTFTVAKTKEAAIAFFREIGDVPEECVSAFEGPLLLSFSPRLVKDEESGKLVPLWFVERFDADSLPGDKETKQRAKLFAASEDALEDNDNGDEDEDDDEDDDDDDDEEDDDDDDDDDDEEELPAPRHAGKK